MIFSGIRLGWGLLTGSVRLPKRTQKIIAKQAAIEASALVVLGTLLWHASKWVMSGGDATVAAAGLGFAVLGFFALYITNLDGMTSLLAVIRQMQGRLPPGALRFISLPPETQRGLIHYALEEFALEVVKAEVAFDGPDWKNKERKHRKALLNDLYKECVLSGLLEETKEGVGQFYPKKK